MYERKLKAGGIDEALVNDNAGKLWQAVQDGWGKPVSKIEYASLEHKTLLQLRYSSFVTAVFKNHENVMNTASLLFDSAGKIKPFRLFEQDALKVMDKYNKAYLQSEYQTAVQTATHAAQWHKYASRGGSLTLRTQRDGRVRNEHRFYDGATYPVGDAFWDIWYPPNGWRCRCFVTWTAEERTEPPANLPERIAPFAHNAGKQGTLFGDGLSYFQVEAKYAEAAKNLFGAKPPIDPARVLANSELYLRLKDDKAHRLVHTDNLSGGVAFTHKEHDRRDFPANKEAAIRLASAGHGVVIRQHIQRDGVKNPELEVDGKMSDLKTPETPSAGSVKGQFKSASKQGIKSVVLNAHSDAPEADLVKGLKDGFHFYPSIDSVLILWKGSVFSVTRKMYELDIVREAFK